MTPEQENELLSLIPTVSLLASKLHDAETNVTKLTELLNSMADQFNATKMQVSESLANVKAHADKLTVLDTYVALLVTDMKTLASKSDATEALVLSNTAGHSANRTILSSLHDASEAAVGPDATKAVIRNVVALAIKIEEGK